ncbi:venom prothrombin activator pseutarin-C non-catalytic subunit-like isoform X2 [Mauremys reevesii]|uniref:venom prothrombin activator pseutarin-C non-catalytic subunit-like isoform X2 n=1 Tax=Mauremys reevesii TaxID=260615 RepID=UPI00193FC481|nr:venom prothrombin activator pseutarin-C non-catalytic subunit-like isoform X2 [Mauremys reevesii]
MGHSCTCLLLLMLLGLWWPGLAWHRVEAAQVREHYIAAETTSWSYRPQSKEQSRLENSEPVFKKIAYREYEADFQKAKPRDTFSGLLGPTLRAEVGDTLVVHFKNMANKPLSIHPQGIAYNKLSEGSLYADRTSSFEKLDDSVPPGLVYKYTWEITAEIGPKEADPPCLTYIYYSHENMVMDFNSGLIGALLICKKGSLKEDGTQKLFDREYVLMFAVFDESKSWQKSTSLLYTINGYANGTLPAGMHGYLNIKEHVGKDVLKKKLSFKELRMIKDWEYFIAAEEITWDYAPEIPETIDRQYKSQYLDNSSNLIGKKYKKAVFRQYTDANFNKRLETPRPKEMGILGPVIRAQVRDIIKIVFKNMASRPYSIYLHGVTLSKDAEGATDPLDFTENSTLSKAVQPGETYTYQWSVMDTDQPTAQDAQCLTRLYHSAVDVTRDIASGLIGPLLICKSETLDKRGVQNKADAEQQAVFAVFDENKSWYLEDNIKQYCSNPSSVKRDDPKFYKSNVMHTINGYVSDSTEILEFSHDRIVQWHVSSIGTQDEVVSIYLSGHTFLTRGKYEDVLNLFPMSGESVTVEMDNAGTWLFASWGSPEMSHGMRLRFRNAKREKDVDYSDDDDQYEIIDFSSENTLQNVPVTSPETGGETEKNQQSSDDFDYQDYLASSLGLRTFGKKSMVQEEMQNLTALAIDEYFGTITKSAGVAAGSDLPFMENSDTLDTDELLEMQSTAPLPTEAGCLHKNCTVAAEEHSLPVTTTAVSPDLASEAGNQSDYEANQSQVSGNYEKTLEGELLRTREEAETKDAAELLPNRGDSMKSSFATLYSEEPQEENSGGEYNFSSSDMLGTDQFPNEYVEDQNVEEKEEEDTKKVNAQFPKHAENLPFAVGHRAENSELNKFKLSDLELPKDKQERNFTLDYASDILISTSSPVVAKDMLGKLSPRDIKSSSKIMNENRNLASGKESYGMETNSAQATDELQNRSRNATVPTRESVSLKKKQQGKFKGYSQFTKGHWKVSSKHPTLKGEKRNVNGTLSTSVILIKTRRRKKDNQKYSSLSLTPRSVRPPKISGEQNCTLLSSEANHTVSLCKAKNTALPSEANLPVLPSRANYTLTPRQFKPVITRLPSGNGDYKEYVPGGSDSEEIADDQYTRDARFTINNVHNPDDIAGHYLRSRGNMRRYYIAAEEVFWDYAGLKKSTMRNDRTSHDGGNTIYKKVIFRSYVDSTFTTREPEGEYEEHLGILGPVIRAEVDDVIQVHFKNLASRPYSLHSHGLFYEKSSEGSSYEDESPDWFKKDDAVQPNDTYTYVWFATKRSGPIQPGAACRSWAYYSAVNPEKDIHSGLIGPILICQKGTLSTSNRPVDTREFVLLFMVFDEEKSWYFNKHSKRTYSEKTSEVQKYHKFHAINGIIYHLQGLRMYKDELVRWHLLNMGGSKDIHVVHFHGQTFTEVPGHQLGVYPLLPGSFRTIEMTPPKAGTWLLDTEVGEYQQAGMQASFIVVEKECKLPMGLMNGLILDSQISASRHINYWEPKLARLNNAGKYNAWSTDMERGEFPWIQVDLQRQVLITGIQTQGAKHLMKSLYVKEFFVTYSKDKRKWITFIGNSTGEQKLFEGNSDAHGIKDNHIDPPIIARYIRVYPTDSYNRPTLRMELLGCEVKGCSLPLGMENGEIKNAQITASSYKKSWYNSWEPSLARLNQEGRVNAWQAKSNNNQQWLQIDLLKAKKITAITTQGCKSMSTEQFVKTYVILYSDEGTEWKPYMDESTSVGKVFVGNENSSGQVKHFLKPPIFSRFIRIVPKTWKRSISLRVELFGCDPS